MNTQNNTLTLGSLFDGSGGFPLGGILSGITPVWASEIEPFPIRVTTKRFPSMKHYGDVSQMRGDKVEPVDIITFGSPCQDMSVAGKRSGLDGNRSSLFYEAIRIVKEMRDATDGKYPRYIVWENVPGAFSSNQGADFQAVLEAVIGIVCTNTQVPMPEKGRWPYADCYVGDGWSVAYRTLDAQYWGVPQRRRRIFLVADFAGGSAGEILFKSEGLSGYSAEGFRSWQRTARSSEICPGATGFDGYNGSLTDNVSSTLGVNCGMSTGRNGVVESAGFCTEHSAKSRSIGYEEERSPTLRAGVVPAALAIENHPTDSRVKVSEDDKVQTLTSRMGTGGNNVPLLMCEPRSWDGKDVSPTLTALNAGGNQRMPDKDNFNCIIEAYGISAKDSNAMKSSNPHSGVYKADTSRTLDGNGGNPSCNQGGIMVIEGNGARPSHKGDGFKESDVMYTLNTVDRHAVFAMTTGSYLQTAEEQAPTLLARDYKDPTVINEPAYGIGRDTFNQGQNAQFMPTVCEEVQPTMVAKGPGAVAQPYGFDPSASRDVGQYFLPDCGNTLVNGTCPGHHNGVMCNDYTVRRLTPTECARLQGFPDWWCSDLETAEPSIEDIRYWYGVFETYRKIMGTSTKAKSLKQIAKWLKDPYSDAAEYKMWGNGVALPCVFFVLAGIVFSTQNEAESTAD